MKDFWIILLSAFLYHCIRSSRDLCFLPLAWGRARNILLGARSLEAEIFLFGGQSYCTSVKKIAFKSSRGKCKKWCFGWGGGASRPHYVSPLVSIFQRPLLPTQVLFLEDKWSRWRCSIDVDVQSVISNWIISHKVVLDSSSRSAYKGILNSSSQTAGKIISYMSSWFTCIHNLMIFHLFDAKSCLVLTLHCVFRPLVFFNSPCS